MPFETCLRISRDHSSHDHVHITHSQLPENNQNTLNLVMRYYSSYTQEALLPRTGEHGDSILALPHALQIGEVSQQLRVLGVF